LCRFHAAAVNERLSRPPFPRGRGDSARREILVQIPTKPAGDSDLKPATIPT
jgi:hypothetical protein